MCTYLQCEELVLRVGGMLEQAMGAYGRRRPRRCRRQCRQSQTRSPDTVLDCRTYIDECSSSTSRLCRCWRALAYFEALLDIHTRVCRWWCVMGVCLPPPTIRPWSLNMQVDAASAQSFVAPRASLCSASLSLREPPREPRVQFLLLWQFSAERLRNNNKVSSLFCESGSP